MMPGASMVLRGTEMTAQGGSSCATQGELDGEGDLAVDGGVFELGGGEVPGFGGGEGGVVGGGGGGGGRRGKEEEREGTSPTTPVGRTSMRMDDGALLVAAAGFEGVCGPVGGGGGSNT